MVDINSITNLNFSGFRDINISRCLRMNAIITKYRKTTLLGTLKNILLVFRILLFKRYEYNFEIKDNSKLLFVYSDIFYRKDSLEKFMSIATLQTSSDVIFPVKIKYMKIRDIRSNPSPKLFNTWIKELSKLEYSIHHKLRFLIQLIQIHQFLNDMKIIEVSKYNLLTVYYDASPLENALVQIFQNHKVKTATLQHGMFISERNVYDPLYSGVEFKSSISDYFLAWNEFTKKEILKEGISEDKIKVLGIPKYIDKKFNESHLGGKGIFGVVLDVPQAKGINEKLIKSANEISKRYNLKYKVKYHPNAKQDEILKVVDSNFYIGYFEKSISIEEYRDQIDFTVIGSSSVFIELVIMRHPTFRLASFNKYDKYLGYNENAFDGIDKFAEIFENKTLVQNNINILFDSFFVADSKKKYIDFYEEFC